ncbi:hypothetical protein [Bacillus sp. RC51]|uniref:hypothetical protein n=1 Tax=Bacillus TaxID=1386 RepID=UPI0038393DCA
MLLFAINQNQSNTVNQVKQLEEINKANEALIKDMQEKVISIQDHQISFLNDSLSNFWAIASTGVAIITLVSTLIGVYIGYSNRKAQKRMEDANTMMEIASQKMTEAQEKIENADLFMNKVEEAMTKLETHERVTGDMFAELNKNIEEKLVNLKAVEEKTDKLMIVQMLKEQLVLVNGRLNVCEKIMYDLLENNPSIEGEEDFKQIKLLIEDLRQNYSDLESESFDSLRFTTKEDMNKLLDKCKELKDDCHSLFITIRQYQYVIKNGKEAS